MSEQSQLPKITVNGQIVPEEAITFELSRLIQFYAQHMPEAEIRKQLTTIRQRAIDQAIGARLLFEEAEKLDIKISEADIDKRVGSMEEQAGGRESFEEIMARQGLDEKTLREQIRRGRKVDKLIAHITSSVAEPTEDDIREHFESHRGEYRLPQRVLAQHILVKAEDDNRTEARERIENLRRLALDGADFSDLASDHSDCPSGRQGGSLGWFSRGMMVPAFDQAAFDMPVGAISDVIETEFGYHIIYKTDQAEEKEADFDVARDKVREFLRHTRRGEVITAHVAGLRAKADVKIEQP